MAYQRFTNKEELALEYLASAGLNPWVKNTSASRVQMFSSHISQCLVIEGAGERRCQTGAEVAFGEFTFSIRMPVNAEVIEVIRKYPTTVGKGSIRPNSITAIVYRDVETNELGVLMVPRYHTLHQYYGFAYDHMPIMDRLTAGQLIQKGTILADSPTKRGGGYRYGLEAEVAFMSVPGIIEDGVIISESLAQRMATQGFEKRAVTWGANKFPLNLYGTETEYRPFPEVGQKIREDGLLFALRREDPLLSPVELTPKALMEPDYTFDELTYGVAGATIIDISSRQDRKTPLPYTPEAMSDQAMRYHTAESKFYQSLLKVYRDHMRMNQGRPPRLTPHFHQILVEALWFDVDRRKPVGPVRQGERSSLRGTFMYNRTPMEEWRIEVTFGYRQVPTEMFKITDTHGGRLCSCF